MFTIDQHLRNRKLETYVENQTTYSLQNAELHLFETQQHAQQVLLKFHQPTLASMIAGKKVMHLQGMESFQFLPGESLILPPNEVMCIDFPEASRQNPTHCLAMTISDEMIKSVICFLNEQKPKADGKEWLFTDYNFHFTNDLAIHQLTQRLLFLFTENHSSKDLFVDLMLKELIVRILQAENKKTYQHTAQQLASSSRMAHVITYIKQHLDQSLSVKQLSEVAHMSESNFYKVFKNELGISPLDYVNEERISLATRLLRNPKKKIKEICFESGFNNLPYFCRLFKKKKRVSPSEFRTRWKKETLS